MWELDLLLGAPAVGNGTLDQNALARLLSFRQLQDATRLAVDQQLAFYQDIDTGTHRDPDGTTTISLYAQIFLNPTVTSVAPDPDLAALPTGGTIADPVLSDHLAGIQAALGVSAADAATLFGLTDNQLTLANLSLIYRVNALAPPSKLSISGLCSRRLLVPPRPIPRRRSRRSWPRLRLPCPFLHKASHTAAGPDPRRDHLRAHPARRHDAHLADHVRRPPSPSRATADSPRRISTSPSAPRSCR